MGNGVLSKYPGGFLNGVAIQNLPVLNSYSGSVVWVDSVTGSDNNTGVYNQPYATISGALAGCTAAKGDIIMCKAGHAESISSATSLTMSKSGVAVIGMGQGANRPTITFTTANTATINVTANNVSFTNMVFVANFLDIAAAFTTTTATNFTLDNCQFTDTSAVLDFVVLVDTGTTTNATDGLTINNCSWYGLGTGSGTAMVKMDGTNARITITNNYMTSAATTGAALMPIITTKVVTGLMANNNIFVLTQATNLATGILITTDGSTNTGMISRNLIQGLDATTEILVTASSGFRFSQNYYSGAADASGYLLPAADS